MDHNGDRKRDTWKYAPSVVRTIYSKLHARTSLTDEATGVTWRFPMQGWEDRIVRGATEDDCWGWLGSWHRQGMPLFNVQRINDPDAKSGLMAGARISMAMTIGRPLTRFERVYNTCHNPACTNPKHLAIGDRSDALMNSPFAIGRKVEYDEAFVKPKVQFVLSHTNKEIATEYGLSMNNVTHLRKVVKEKYKMKAELERIQAQINKRKAG